MVRAKRPPEYKHMKENTTIKVTLVSKRAVKWPRYRIELDPWLSIKEAINQTLRALQVSTTEIATLSQFGYNVNTGVVDTRIRRTAMQ